MSSTKRTRARTTSSTQETDPKKSRFIDPDERDEDWSQEDEEDAYSSEYEDEDEDESEYETSEDEGEESEVDLDGLDEGQETSDEDEEDDEEREDREEELKENQKEYKKAIRAIKKGIRSLSAGMRSGHKRMRETAVRAKNVQTKCLTKYGVKDADTLALVKMSDFDVISSLKNPGRTIDEITAILACLTIFVSTCIDFIVICTEAVRFTSEVTGELVGNEDYDKIVHEMQVDEWAESIKEKLEKYNQFFDDDSELYIDSENELFASLLLEAIQAFQTSRDFIDKVRVCFTVIESVFLRYEGDKVEEADKVFLFDKTIDSILDFDTMFVLEGHINSIMASKDELFKARNSFYTDMTDTWEKLGGAIKK